jgi:hypothetical protein
MEIIIGIIIIGLGYALYRTFQPKATVVETAVAYKVEAPAQESTPVAEPAKEVTTDASPPAKTRKAPVKKPVAAKKPKAAVKKPAPAKKPVLAKSPAKPKK